LEKYEEVFPQVYTTWLMNLKVKILVTKKNFEEADKAVQIFKERLDAFIKATGRNKWIRYYYFLQGLLALEQDKLPESVLHLMDAVSLLAAGQPSDYAQFMEPLARAYYQDGDLDRAQDEYEKIMRLTTGRKAWGDIYAKSFYMLGKIHEQQGSTAKAIENYEKFLDLWKDADPGLPEVDDARKRLSYLNSS
jgi:tetratricopeptide (TPR) repeat protein